MPIHDQGYRRYGGDKIASGRAWLVIAGAGIRPSSHAALSRPAPRVVDAVFRPGASDLRVGQPAPGMRSRRSRPKRSGSFSSSRASSCFFITVYVGSGLIANDRRANALQIYLSKPLTRTEYVLGKLAVLMTFLLLVTWIPDCCCFSCRCSSPAVSPFWSTTCISFLRSRSWRSSRRPLSAVSMLALSSLSNSSRYVGILYTSLIFFHAGAFRRAAVCHRRLDCRVGVRAG